MVKSVQRRYAMAVTSLQCDANQTAKTMIALWSCRMCVRNPDDEEWRKETEVVGTEDRSTCIFFYLRSILLVSRRRSAMLIVPGRVVWMNWQKICHVNCDEHQVFMCLSNWPSFSCRG